MRPKVKDYVGPLALGTRIHAALEEHYVSGTPLLVAHQKFVEIDKEILISESREIEPLESEADLGRIMLEGYLEWIEETGIDSDLEFISAEEVVTMPMFSGEVELQGKLDMRVRRKSDGARLFRDWKTVGGSLSEYANQLEMNEQNLTYMLLEMMKEGEEGRSDGGIFTLFKKVKRTARATPPFYDQIEVRHNVFTLRSFWDRIHGVISDIMRVRKALDDGEPHALVAYPNPTRDCKWKCQFASICTMFDDGSSAEQALTDMFDEADPYDYYGSDNKGNE